MPRTRGLRRALGRQGREGRVDEDVGPSDRQRPTASARRARAREMDVDVDATDVIHEQPQEPSLIDDVARDSGYPGGPHDTSLLRSFSDHVAVRVWDGQERVKLKLASHGRKVSSLGRPHPQIDDAVTQTGLGPLIQCCQETGDRGLISAFSERWHRETSSFHLPCGEISITLDDVSSLLHLPVTGAFHTYDAIHVQVAVDMLVELLGVTVADAFDETGQCHGPYVRLSWLRDIYHTRCEGMQWTEVARAFMLHLVGCTIFANKSSTHVSVVYLEPFRDLTLAGGYAWGAAALVHMYDNLTEASHHKTKHMAGFITLVQCWIYEHFPTVGNMTKIDDYDESLPRACQWRCGKAFKVQQYRKRLDRLTPDAVRWAPYDDHRRYMPFPLISLYSGNIRWGTSIISHLPERLLRRFGFVQTILPSPTDYDAPPLTTEQIDDRWLHFSDYLAPTGDMVTHPYDCVPGYLDWFYIISHPFIIPPEDGEEPRLPPRIPHPHPPTRQEPVAADDIPRHAMGTCQMIADRLQQVLNLQEIPQRSASYTLIQQCLTLARGVTDEGNVYVRQRRRRR